MESYEKQVRKTQSVSKSEALDYIGAGWRTIIENVYSFAEQIWYTYNIFIAIEQVKEKFGTLRIYYYIAGATAAYDTDLIHQTMLAFEQSSVGKCEDCGANGRIHTIYGWLKTLCDNCYKETIA